MPLIDACSWDHPGRYVYEGTSTAAIMAMSTIPLEHRQILIAKVEVGYAAADDHVVITRDNISGQNGVWRNELSYMAFGSKGQVCKTITRDKWDPNLEQRALVYCSAEWCVARPSICNNWSIITRMKQHNLDIVPVPEKKLKVQVYTVPEPSSMILVLTALLLGALNDQRQQFWTSVVSFFKSFWNRKS